MVFFCLMVDPDDASSYKCTCDAGYSGADCASNDCVGHSCNDGTCSIVAGAATCTCDAGYIGDTCSDHVCDDQTCTGNGNCVVDPNDGASHQCNCNSGYSGSDCSGRFSSSFNYLENCTKFETR